MRRIELVERRSLETGFASKGLIRLTSNEVVARPRLGTGNTRFLFTFQHKTLLYFIYTFRVVCESERLLRGDRGAHGSRGIEIVQTLETRLTREKKCVCLPPLPSPLRVAGRPGRGGRGRLDSRL